VTSGALQTPPRPPRLRPAQTLPAVARELLARIVIEPVVTGRLRSAGWPTGLRTIVLVALVLASATLGLMVAAPILRILLPLSASAYGTTLPSALPPLALALPLFALALFQTGAVHGPWWLRLTALFATAATYSALGSNTVTGSAVWIVFAIIAGCWLAILGQQLLRSKRPFAWWEPIVPLLANFVVLVISLAPRLRTDSAGNPGDLVSNAESALVWVGVLAVPAAIAAGFAIAQVATSTVVWSIELTRRYIPARGMLVVLAAVAVWRILAEAWKLVDAVRPLIGILAATAVLAGSVLVWLVLDMLADRAERRRQAGAAGDTGIFHLGEEVANIAFPVAVLLAVAGLVSFLVAPWLYGYGLAQATGHPQVAQVFVVASGIPALVGHALATTAGRVVAGLVLLLGAAWLARRGRRGVAEVVGIAAVLRIATQLYDPSLVLARLPLIATVVLTALLAIWGLRRRLTGVRVEALVVGYLIAAVFGSRQIFADPFEIVVGGVAAVLFGLVWEFLTGSADANADSAKYPRPTRVLLLVSNTVVGIGILAWIAWARDSSHTVDLVYQQQVGDLVLGGALLISVLCAVTVSALHNRDIGTPEP
jgi:hypothetical protein